MDHCSSVHVWNVRGSLSLSAFMWRQVQSTLEGWKALLNRFKCWVNTCKGLRKRSGHAGILENLTDLMKSMIHECSRTGTRWSLAASPLLHVTLFDLLTHTCDKLKNCSLCSLSLEGVLTVRWCNYAALAGRESWVGVFFFFSVELRPGGSWQLGFGLPPSPSLPPLVISLPWCIPHPVAAPPQWKHTLSIK